MNLAISKFKDWKLRSRIILLTVVSISSIILLGFQNIFFFQIRHVYKLFTNDNRVHKRNLIADNQNYNKPEASRYTVHNSASLKNLNNANIMAYSFSNVSDHLQNLHQKNFNG